MRFRLFCNSEERLEDAYQRYLVKGVHESFDLAGVPVFLDVVGKPKQQGRKFFAPPGTKPEDAPAPARPVTKSKRASVPKGGKARKAAGSARKKSYSRWDKPRSLKGRAARQARK